MSRSKQLKIGLLIAFALETLCVTYCIKITVFTSFFAVLYFISGITIAVFALSFRELTPFFIKKKGRINSLFFFRIAGICLMGAGMYYFAKCWMVSTPIDFHIADMLPIIREMNLRFISGQWGHIYDPIPKIWNGIKPIYLPTMWLPFIISMIFRFDMRWITVGGLFFAFSCFIFIFYPTKEKILSFLTFLIGCILFVWLFSEEMHGFISMTEEGVVVAYYVLLVLALLSGNMVLIGIATSLCMLSRYALIGWLPAFLLFLLLSKKRKQAVNFSITGLLCLMILCILPFGLGPLISLAKLPGNYIGFARTLWIESPEVFDYGLGFARFFGQEQISSLHALLILLTFTVPIFFVIVCFFLNKRRAISNIPLAALKISVVVFFNFIDVPYIYLFYTSSFISLLMVAAFLRQEQPIKDSEPKVVL